MSALHSIHVDSGGAGRPMSALHSIRMFHVDNGQLAVG